jgi:ABC-type phosphate transport system substrate-binding protein
MVENRRAASTINAAPSPDLTVRQTPSYRLLLFSLLLALLTSCTSPTLTPRPTPALVRVAASDVTQPLLLDLSAAYAAVNPAVVVAPSLAPEASLSGLLSAGQVDLAFSTAPNPKLFATPIGYVPFQVVVNPNNPLKGLSLAQAQGLLAGRLPDWSQAAGPSGPVVVVTRGDGTAAAQALSATAMGPLTVTTSALVAPTWGAMRQLLGQNSNAIGYLIGPEVDATVTPLALQGPDGSPVPLRILAVAEAASDPAGAARAFLAWAQSPDGQAAAGKRNEKLAVLHP